MSTKTIKPIRDGEKVGDGGWGVGREREGGGWGGGERKIIYVSLHCHHRNNVCIKVGSIKVGSDESHFNVSSTTKDKVITLS